MGHFLSGPSSDPSACHILVRPLGSSLQGKTMSVDGLRCILYARIYITYMHTILYHYIQTHRSLSPYSHTYYYGYSITHSRFYSRLKSLLFCKSSLPQPFLFLFQDSLYGFPRLLLLLLSICVSLLFSFFLFLYFFSCRFRAVD